MNRLIALSFIIILSLTFAVSCKQDSSRQSEKNQEPVLNKVRTININSDSTQSYSLYLPTSYNPNDRFPAVFLFDPHANGRLPVDKLRKKAEELGYILIGSNNSRNGADNLTYICQSLIQDALNKFRIDRNRIFAGGFSGGARVAGSVLPQITRVQSVFSCGAGLMQAIQLIKKKNLTYLGIIGEQDFNYREAIQTHQVFNQKGIENHLLSFQGGHEWPPDSILSKSLDWFECQSMKNNPKNVSEDWLNTFYKKQINKAEFLAKNKNKLESYHQYRWVYACVKDLLSTKKLTKRIQKLKNSPEIARYYQQRNQLLQQEQRLYNQYIQAYMHRDTEWWKREINEYEKKISQTSNPQQKNFLIRLKNYWSMAGFSLTSNALEKDQIEKARHTTDIYQMVDPENPDVYYLKAKLFALTGNQEQAMEHLKKAADKGFEDWDRIRKDSIFIKTLQNKKLKPLINSEKQL